MEREVFPNRLLSVHDELTWIRRNYDLGKSEQVALNKAAIVIFGLSNRPSVAPIDPDKKMPLLARCNSRNADDERDIAEARRLLAGDMRTFDLATELGRLDQWDEFGSIPGWRWLRAANLILGPKTRDDVRGNWRYFAAVARGFKEHERDIPLRNSQLPEPTLEDFRRMLAEAS